MTDPGLPSPLAQKESFFFAERLTGDIGEAPGANIAPAQRYWLLPSIVPLICRDPFEPLAPSCTTLNSAFDLPPMSESVETLQPLPKFTVGLLPSKSLTSPF